MEILKSFIPENFNLEHTSIWRFPERGSWATHDGSYRGNWSPYIPRNIILRYSNEGDFILDQFVGSGTTLIEAKILNRNAYGIDINPISLELAKHKCNFNCNSDSKLFFKLGNATNLNFIKNESIDLICTHPPYANIIKYSNGIKNDLSLLSYDNFLEQMILVAKESFRILKKGKFCAFLIGDMRKSGYVYPLGFECLNKFISVGFKLKEIIIKEQFNCASTEKWVNKNIEKNFLLLTHEYLFVLKK